VNEIIIKKKNEAGNDASDVDGIGARFIKMPKEIFIKLMSVPEFDWILESPYPDMPNWGVGKFIQMNPQFFVTNYEKMGGHEAAYPSFVINKDGAIFDLNKMKFISQKRKGKWAK
jgi:hypothetical protein